MRNTLRTLSFGLLAATGLTAAAQGHTIFVAGHLTPCNPANAGTAVDIVVYGSTTAPVTTATTTLNENCYYYLEMLVPDPSGLVYVTTSCGNGTVAQDSSHYVLTPPFTTDVIIDLACSAPPPCSACFNMTQNGPFSGTFTSCSSGGVAPYTYVWDFSGPGGGGVTGNGIVHTFPAGGPYAACLNITDASGCMSSICHQVYVDPNGTFSLNAPTDCNACINVEQAFSAGQATPFVAQFSSCSSGSGSLLLEWQLPSGVFTTQASPTYQFSGPGAYGVCLYLTSSNGCTSMACDTLTVDANGMINTQPAWYDCEDILWGDALPGNPCATMTGTTGVWNNLCECTTDTLYYDCLQVPFGPNMPGTPCQLVNTVGTWDAQCTCVPDTPGDCEAGFWVIQAFENGDTLNGQPIPNTLWVWNLSEGGSGFYQYLWSFGDGTSSTVPFPTHTYAGNGPYLLCLTINDSEGCTDTYCDSVSVDENGLLNGLIVQGHGSTSAGQPRSGFTVNVMDPLSNAVNEINVFDQVTLFPNPAADRVTVTFLHEGAGLVNAEVLDANGRRVRTTSLRAVNGPNRMDLELSALPEGLYMLRLDNGGRSTGVRFVKGH